MSEKFCVMKAKVSPESRLSGETFRTILVRTLERPEKIFLVKLRILEEVFELPFVKMNSFHVG